MLESDAHEPTVDTREARNKELVRRMHLEVLEAKDLDRLDGFVARNFRSHNMPPGLPNGVEGIRRFFAMFSEALPDLTVTIDVEVAEGDFVAVRSTVSGTHRDRLMGIPPTGRPLAIDSVDVVRIADERIVEHWGLTNTVGVLQQVGRLARLRWLFNHIVRGSAAPAEQRD